MSKEYLLFLFLLLYGCSSLRGKEALSEKYFENPKPVYFDVIEGDEKFRNEVEKGKKGDQYYFRQTMNYKDVESKTPLEKIYSISKDHSFKLNDRSFQILFPFKSVFAAWVEGKRLSSKVEFDKEGHQFIVNSKNGMEKIIWRDEEEPKILCFFTQIVPCLARTGAFLAKGRREQESIPFTIIWERYPFLNTFYENVENELFSPAILTIERREEGHLGFSVEVFNQVINYQVTLGLELEHFSWVAQGIVWSPEKEHVLRKAEHIE